jgi:hypothetical protein
MYVSIYILFKKHPAQPFIADVNFILIRGMASFNLADESWKNICLNLEKKTHTPWSMIFSQKVA